MENEKTWWHPAFYAAMQMEFSSDKENLIYLEEVPLSHKPLQMDMMIIEKHKDMAITNEIGWMFRKYNVIEYKSPEDSLNIDTFYKVQAYASLYKSVAGNDTTKAADISVTMVRTSYPRELFRSFKEQGFTIRNVVNGIYYVEGNMLFPTQIVVTNKLDFQKHVWVSSLRKNMTKQMFMDLIVEMTSLQDEKDKKLADAMMHVIMQKNIKSILVWKEDSVMSEALQQLMEPELNEKWKQGIEQGLIALVNTLTELCVSPEDILQMVQKNEQYKNVTMEQIEEILN